MANNEYDYSYQCAVEVMKQEIFNSNESLPEKIKLRKLNDELFQLDEVSDKFARNFQKALLTTLTRKSDPLRQSNSSSNLLSPSVPTTPPSPPKTPNSYLFSVSSPFFPNSPNLLSSISSTSLSSSNNITQPENYFEGADLQCISWAHRKIPTLLEQSLISFLSSSCDFICSSKSKLPSHLFQPFEDYLLSRIHDVIMEALKLQMNKIENDIQKAIAYFQSSEKLMTDILNIDEKFLLVFFDIPKHNLTSITTEDVKTPMQKLLCLKEIILSLYPLIFPPSSPPTSPSSIKKRQKAKKLDDDENNGVIPTLESLNSQYNQIIYQKMAHKKDVNRNQLMRMLLLLLIKHYPPYLCAHLAYINFHTFNDETFRELSQYLLYFKSALNQLLYSYHSNETHPSLAKPKPSRGIHMWGCGVGFESYALETFPTLIPSLDIYNINQIKCGEKHILALTQSGKAMSYGWGGVGQLGHGDLEDKSEFTEIQSLSSYTITCIDTSGTHSAAVIDDGTLFCWGSNSYGQIGNGETSKHVVKPHPIAQFGGNKCVIQVSCGGAHTLALIAGGEVWSWGLGDNGRLGHGNNNSRSIPSPIDFFRDTKIMAIECGWAHSLCVSDQNYIYTFGKGNFGQLGNGSYHDEHLPVKLPFIGEIIQIEAYYHTVALTKEGLYTWGWGEHGQLGNGDTSNQSSPCKIDIQFQLKQIACSNVHTLALTKEGLVLSWGSGMYGQLGLGDTSSQAYPTVIQSLFSHRITQIDCGLCYSLAIEGDNTDDASDF